MTAGTGQTLSLENAARIRDARAAADCPEVEPDIAAAHDRFVELLASGVPIRAAVSDLFRGAYRAGYLNGSSDSARARTRARAEQSVADALAALAALAKAA